MASLSNDADSLPKENGGGTSIMRLSDCICPICLYILIEPVTMPCRHELCMNCFKQNVQEASLTCPMCRLRISTWARRAKRNNKLVNQVRWEAIKRAFPKKVDQRQQGIEGESSSDEDEEVEIPMPRLAEPGEIRSEYEAEMQRLQEERDLAYQEEIERSKPLIVQLQMEEEQRRLELEEQKRRDEELAKELADALNASSSTLDTPGIGKFLERRQLSETETTTASGRHSNLLMDRFLERGRQSPADPNKKEGDKYPYTCVSPWEKEEDTGKRKTEANRPPSNYSEIFTDTKRPDSFNSAASTVSYVYVDSRPESVVSETKEPRVEISGEEVLVEGFGKATNPHIPVIDLEQMYKDFPEPSSNPTDDAEVTDATDKGMRSPSPDSISQEMSHFKPIRSSPRTPPRRLPGGKVCEPTLVRSTPINPQATQRRLNMDCLSPDGAVGSPIMHRQLLALGAERQAQVQALSKGTCTEFKSQPLKKLKRSAESQTAMMDHTYWSPDQARTAASRTTLQDLCKGRTAAAATVTRQMSPPEVSRRLAFEGDPGPPREPPDRPGHPPDRAILPLSPIPSAAHSGAILPLVSNLDDEEHDEEPLLPILPPGLALNPPASTADSAAADSHTVTKKTAATSPESKVVASPAVSGTIRSAGVSSDARKPSPGRVYQMKGRLSLRNKVSGSPGSRSKSSRTTPSSKTATSPATSIQAWIQSSQTKPRGGKAAAATASASSVTDHVKSSTPELPTLGVKDRAVDLDVARAPPPVSSVSSRGSGDAPSVPTVSVSSSPVVITTLLTPSTLQQRKALVAQQKYVEETPPRVHALNTGAGRAAKTDMLQQWLKPVTAAPREPCQLMQLAAGDSDAVSNTRSTLSEPETAAVVESEPQPSCSHTAPTLSPAAAPSRLSPHTHSEGTDPQHSQTQQGNAATSTDHVVGESPAAIQPGTSDRSPAQDKPTQSSKPKKRSRGKHKEDTDLAPPSETSSLIDIDSDFTPPKKSPRRKPGRSTARPVSTPGKDLDPTIEKENVATPSKSDASVVSETTPVGSARKCKNTRKTPLKSKRTLFLVPQCGETSDGEGTSGTPCGKSARPPMALPLVVPQCADNKLDETGADSMAEQSTSTAAAGKATGRTEVSSNAAPHQQTHKSTPRKSRVQPPSQKRVGLSGLSPAGDSGLKNTSPSPSAEADSEGEVFFQHVHSSGVNTAAPQLPADSSGEESEPELNPSQRPQRGRRKPKKLEDFVDFSSPSKAKAVTPQKRTKGPDISSPPAATSEMVQAEKTTPKKGRKRLVSEAASPARPSPVKHRTGNKRPENSVPPQPMKPDGHGQTPSKRQRTALQDTLNTEIPSIISTDAPTSKKRHELRCDGIQEDVCVQSKVGSEDPVVTKPQETSSPNTPSKKNARVKSRGKVKSKPAAPEDPGGLLTDSDTACSPPASTSKKNQAEKTTPKKGRKRMVSDVASPVRPSPVKHRTGNEKPDNNSVPSQPAVPNRQTPTKRQRTALQDTLNTEIPSIISTDAPTSKKRHELRCDGIQEDVCVQSKVGSEDPVVTKPQETSSPNTPSKKNGRVKSRGKVKSKPVAPEDPSGLLTDSDTAPSPAKSKKREKQFRKKMSVNQKKDNNNIRKPSVCENTEALAESNKQSEVRKNRNQRPSKTKRNDSERDTFVEESSPEKGNKQRERDLSMEVSSPEKINKKRSKMLKKKFTLRSRVAGGTDSCTDPEPDPVIVDSVVSGSVPDNKRTAGSEMASNEASTSSSGKQTKGSQTHLKRNIRMLKYIEYSPDGLTGKKLVPPRRSQRRGPKDAVHTKQTKLFFSPGDDDDFMESRPPSTSHDTKSTAPPVGKSRKQRLEEVRSRIHCESRRGSVESEGRSPAHRDDTGSDFSADREIHEVRRERSSFATEEEYRAYVEEQDFLLAKAFQEEYDLEVRYNLTAIRKKGTDGQYMFRPNKGEHKGFYEEV